MACNRCNNQLGRTDAQNFADLLGTGTNFNTGCNSCEQDNEDPTPCCENNVGLSAADRRKIYEYLGCRCYKLFQNITVPDDYPSLNCCLSVLAYGGTAPACFPTFKELCCLGLKNRGKRCMQNSCDCLTPLQRQRVYLYLGRECYRIMKCLDICDINELLLNLATSNCPSVDYKTFEQLLGQASGCPLQPQCPTQC